MVAIPPHLSRKFRASLALLKLALIVVFIARRVAGSQYAQQLPLSSLMEASEIATGAGAIASFMSYPHWAGTPLRIFWVN